MNDQRSWIEIDLKALSENLNNLKQFLHPNQKFLQVVKADAYGHGALQIAKTALECGAEMLGVANIEEAIHLRFHKIEAPILILSPSLESEVKQILAYNIIPSVSEIDFCVMLNDYAKKENKIVPIHLKIDTGMNRNGIKVVKLKDFYKRFVELKNLCIEGLFSHFAASDDDEEFTLEQYKQFIDSINIFKSEEFNLINQALKYTHIANSSATVNPPFSKMGLIIGNLVRIGIMSYGYYLNSTLKSEVNLTPIMSFKSRVSHLSFAQHGETIGYNRAFTVEKDMRYAIIPVGYADGYDFLLANKSKVMINNHLCPVIGKISMDMICVDITGMDDVKLNNEVILLGDQHPSIHASNLTNLYNASVYELLCQLGRRAKRFYFCEGKLIDDEPLQRRTFIPKDFSSEKLNNIIQQAITERTQNNEISSVIYHDILKYFFTDSDRDITYRSDFKYLINFSENEDKEYYKVNIILNFKKTLVYEDFSIACACESQKLQYFFKQKNCEYRWLLDKNLTITSDMFALKKVTVNNINIAHRSELVNDCLVYIFDNGVLKSLLGEQVDFCIMAETLYSKNSHQLSIYLNEITKGVEVNFSYLKKFFDTETTLIFSGRERFPIINQTEKDDTKSVSIKTEPDTWVFPTSGIVFSLKKKEH